MDSTDIKAMICCQSGNGPAKGVVHNTGKQGHGRHFGGSGKERRHGCGRSFIDIWGPHVERHSGDFERQTLPG